MSWTHDTKTIGDITLIVSVPDDDLIQHTYGDCVCGTVKERTHFHAMTEHGVAKKTILRIIHQSLDGRELFEADDLDY